MAWTTTAAIKQRGLFQPVRARTTDLPRLLIQYYNGLSRRPYAWNPETERIYIRGKDYALDYPNLAHGLPNSAQWIVLDIDRPLEHLEFGYEDRPRPHVVAQNPANGHAHLYFPLARPAKIDHPWLKKSIVPKLVLAWEADPHFSGKVGKNLLRPDLWDIYTRNARSWTFDGLANGLAGFTLPRQVHLWPELSDQPGRNCEVFEGVRGQAYKLRRRGADYEALLAACEAWCEEQNTYRVPLAYAECRHIAKSIAKWTAAHLAPGHVWHADQGRKSGARRREKSADQAGQALDLNRQGLSSRKIAKGLGVSRGAVLRWHGHAEATPLEGAASQQQRAGGRNSGEERRKKTADQAVQAQALHGHGLGTPSIARTLGVSRGAVRWWLGQARQGGVAGKVDPELNQDQPWKLLK